MEPTLTTKQRSLEATARDMLESVDWLHSARGAELATRIVALAEFMLDNDAQSIDVELHENKNPAKPNMARRFKAYKQIGRAANGAVYWACLR